MLLIYPILFAIIISVIIILVYGIARLCNKELSDIIENQTGVQIEL